MTIGYYQIGKQRVAAIDETCDFPPLHQALKQPNGLLAIGGDLSPARLLSAYRQGIFPWFSANEPICWYSPNPRMVLFPNELKISTSLKKTLKNHPFETRVNSNFAAVIAACAATPRPDQDGTWITPDMQAAYCELHKQGYAVSSECWLNGELVGGCYGVKIGRMFYGESMFYTQANASKIAFVNLVDYLNNQQVEMPVKMIDCQMKTPLLASFGGREIMRDDFIQTLTKLVN